MICKTIQLTQILPSATEMPQCNFFFFSKSFLNGNVSYIIKDLNPLRFLSNLLMFLCYIIKVNSISLGLQDFGQFCYQNGSNGKIS